MAINQEKQEIIDCRDNVLVTANPGTGKTFLLAHKYVDLLKQGYKPEEMLCLTFTRKARREMEDRIIKLIDENDLVVDRAALNIHTFHSYALENIDKLNLVSSNVLRYAIYQFMKEDHTLNYGDRYLLDTIVPKMENLIRYLKSYGITVDMINVEDAKNYVSSFKNYSKEDLDLFLEKFVRIFHYYEQMKGTEGIDYTDMLLEFLNQENIPRYRYVLVDELQDVNTMEADIALRSSNCFLSVGDQKQAIFGFQGGSILNFKKFEHAHSFVLSENFRSTNAILEYARCYFSERTKEKTHVNELKDLQNKTKGIGEKPVIYDISGEDRFYAVCQLASRLADSNDSVAVIARTNNQLRQIASVLETRGVEFSSTFLSASAEAQKSIVTFLKGVLTDRSDCLKNAFFTPFFPISLKDAFELAEKKYVNLQDVYEKAPSFKKIKMGMGNVEDVHRLFHQVILPVCMSYGEEFVLAGLAMKDAFAEAMDVVSEKTIDEVCAFLDSTDLLSMESHVEKKIMLTTVHKAKGKQFDSVIYVPSKTQDRSNFQDAVVKAILLSKGINAEEELEEETLRVNFVAFTRAKDQLFIVTDKPQDFSNDASMVKEFSAVSGESNVSSEAQKKAFSLFVNKQYDQAKKLLEVKQSWLSDFVSNHFLNLDHLSFSSVTTDAYEYFQQNILRLGETSEALTLGSNVHVLAEKLVAGEEYKVKEGYTPYETNIKHIVDEIHQKYPVDVVAEEIFRVSLSDLIGVEDTLLFTGKIDAVFKNDNDEYLIVDWKTSKNKNHGSAHRRQLMAYKKAFSLKYEVPLDQIKVAIGYVSLKNTINDGIIGKELDMNQPRSSSFNTFSKHVKKVLSWRNDTSLFFEDLKQVKDDDALLRSILEQYGKEEQT